MRVIAEGVETERQVAWLRDAGCEEGQGHLFAKPLATEDFEARYVPRA
jgi:EAL domain-containing protein (putative c-di-GMP-specific phosphodiesterase class I)